MDYSYLHRDCWLEIDLDILAANFMAMKKLVGPSVKIMPAVKANAYAHGIVACGMMLEKCGADYLGVGNIDEGILLRKHGVKMPLLIFAGNLISEVADVYIKYHLIPTVFTYEQAKSINDATSSFFPIFIKIDTGRGRLGINAEDFPNLFEKISKLSKIKVEGVYSHMCPVDWPDKKSSDYAQWQFNRFQGAMEGIESAAKKIPFRQLANTPASIAFPRLRLTGICPGRAIWGFSPLEKREGHPNLEYPMIAWKSRLLHVQEVLGGKFGEGFSTVKLDTPKRIGVMAGGISDGISTAQSHGKVLVCGHKVPVASSICLEHTILDLTNCPEAKPGDEVVIFGKQGDEEITMDEVRCFWKKDLMSFWTGITPHVQRLYFSKGHPVAVSYDDELKDLSK